MVRGIVTMQGQTKLLQVVPALHPPRGLAGALDRRQQEPDQRGDDRDHHKQLNERKTTTTRGSPPGASPPKPHLLRHRLHPPRA